MPCRTCSAPKARALVGCSFVIALAHATSRAAHSIDALVVGHAFEIQSVSIDGVAELAVDHRALEAVHSAASVVIENFPTSATASHTFNLRPFQVFTNEATLIVADHPFDTIAPRPAVTLLRGSVDNDPASIVYLAITPGAVNGFFETDGQRFIVATSRDPGSSPVVYAPDKLTSLDEPSTLPSCGAEELPEYHAVLANFARPSVDRGDSDAPLPRRRALLAIEADNEFVSMFVTDADCTAYVATLFGAVSTIYHRDLNIDLRINHLRLWRQLDDPWTETVAQTQLSQLRLYYIANMQGVERSAAHLLSQRAFTGAGGTAYLNGLCSDLGYGISGYLNGFFPVPLEDNQAQNWDPYVVTHELGHNFGAPHTHQMAPPIDACGLGDCSAAASGTIMSYCHTCSGALRNIAFDFHPRIRNERMIPFLNNVICNLTAPAACLADFDSSGAVTGTDLAYILGRFFVPTAAPYTQGDLNGDSIVTGTDLSVFLRVFGQPCN